MVFEDVIEFVLSDPLITVTSIAMVLIGLVILGLAFYGVYSVWHKKKVKDSYKDKYKEIVELGKSNCPLEIKGYEFRTTGDKEHAGVFKGYIVGYNQANITNKKKVRDQIIYNPMPFNILNPFSWFSKDIIAWVDPLKRTALSGHVKWITVGTDKEGFYEFSNSDSILTPSFISEITKDKVDLKNSINILKELGELTGDALHGNPGIRGIQKLNKETQIDRK